MIHKRKRTSGTVPDTDAALKARCPLLRAAAVSAFQRTSVKDSMHCPLVMNISSGTVYLIYNRIHPLLVFLNYYHILFIMFSYNITFAMDCQSN